MGNSSSSGYDANRVEIMQQGKFLCGGRFSPSDFDQRLGKFMTGEEFASTIEKCNDTLKRMQKKHGFVCVVVIVFVVILCGLGVSLSTWVHSPEIVSCGATGGLECDAETPEDQAVESDCCIWSCCGSSGCTRIDKTDETTCECTRSSCSAVEIDGPVDVTPEVNPWAGSMIGVCGVVGTLCCLGNAFQVMAAAWSLKGKMSKNFDAWRSKGLSAEYFAGRKHYQARIVVYLPQGADMPPAASVGAGRSMQVAVPPGAAAGTTLQVQAPTGETLQVQVPPGIPPGGAFAVQY